MAKSVIRSAPDTGDCPNWKTKVSLPIPPVRVSAPVPPLRVSLPAFPVRVLLRLLPINELLPAFPVPLIYSKRLKPGLF